MVALSVLDQLQNNWLHVENTRELLAAFVVIKFFLVVAIVSFLVWSIRKGSQNHCPDTARLLDEMKEEERAPRKKISPSREKEEWERDPDWWKEGGGNQK